MKIAYFDCFAGISGDMTLGALIDAGVDSEALIAQLSTLRVDGFTLTTERVQKQGISATNVHVNLTHDHHHHDHGHHHHRGLPEILEIIANSSVSQAVKDKSS